MARAQSSEHPFLKLQGMHSDLVDCINALEFSMDLHTEGILTVAEKQTLDYIANERERKSRMLMLLYYKDQDFWPTFLKILNKHHHRLAVKLDESLLKVTAEGLPAEGHNSVEPEEESAPLGVQVSRDEK